MGVLYLWDRKEGGREMVGVKKEKGRVRGGPLGGWGGTQLEILQLRCGRTKNEEKC